MSAKVSRFCVGAAEVQAFASQALWTLALSRRLGTVLWYHSEAGTAGTTAHLSEVQRVLDKIYVSIIEREGFRSSHIYSRV